MSCARKSTGMTSQDYNAGHDYGHHGGYGYRGGANYDAYGKGYAHHGGTDYARIPQTLPDHIVGPPLDAKDHAGRYPRDAKEHTGRPPLDANEPEPVSPRHNETRSRSPRRAQAELTRAASAPIPFAQSYNYYPQFSYTSPQAQPLNYNYAAPVSPRYNAIRSKSPRRK